MIKKYTEWLLLRESRLSKEDVEKIVLNSLHLSQDDRQESMKMPLDAFDDSSRNSVVKSKIFVDNIPEDKMHELQNILSINYKDLTVGGLISKIIEFSNYE